MNIIWHGQSCFQIITQVEKNSQETILIDPFSEEVGLNLPKTKPSIVLISHNHSDHNNIKKVEGEPFIIDTPGEYEIKGINIYGIPSFHDEEEGKKRGNNTIYIVETEEIKLCHLGDFGERELSDGQVEAIDDIDILMIPIGGVYTIDAKKASGIIAQIEPRIAIPMHYQLPKLKIKLDKVDDFLKVMGIDSKEKLPKLNIKKRDISPEEKTKIIVLEQR